MGVNDLWSILDPVRESVPLQSLNGKILAVDLSLWICEAKNVKEMMGRVNKPHLRNLFFRVSSLILMGVKLIFVMEGEAPKLKAETMKKRLEMRYGTSAKSSSGKAGRSHFAFVLKECSEMLTCLGIPWVTAAGEAEAMCAFLNAHGIVDGCITNDGDAFLYGAQTVYKNFNMFTKDPHIDCYKMSRITSELNLARETLVGLAILRGCDYLPKGVPGIGKEQTVKLIKSLKGETLLEKFQQWKEQFQKMGTPVKLVKKVTHCTVCRHPGSNKNHKTHGCKLCNSTQFCIPQDYDYICLCAWHQATNEQQAGAVEANIKRKAKACAGFPFHEIIKEFLVPKDKPIMEVKWRKPNLSLIQKFALEKMEWPKHYTSEKVLILMTYMEMINRLKGKESVSQIKPIRILKARIKNGISCFEIIWEKPEGYVYADDHPVEAQQIVTTVEEESLFQTVFPEIVDHFIKEKDEASKNKKKKKNKQEIQKSPDDIADLLAEMNICPSSEEDQKDDAHIIINQSEYKDVIKITSQSFGDSSSIPVPEHPEFYENLSNNILKPSSSPALTSHHQSPTFSPSVSALIDELQLSNIDWDGTSFNTSPKSVACNFPSGQIQDKNVLFLQTKDSFISDEKYLAELNVETLKEKPALNNSPVCAAQTVNGSVSLRERVLLKNLNPFKLCAEENSNSEFYRIKPLQCLNSAKKIYVSSGQTKVSLEFPTIQTVGCIKGNNDMTSKFCDNKNDLYIVDKKQKRIKPSNSDNTRCKNVTKTVKRSVCHNLSSGEDSDTENTKVVSKKQQLKFKPTKKCGALREKMHQNEYLPRRDDKLMPPTFIDNHDQSKQGTEKQDQRSYAYLNMDVLIPTKVAESKAENVEMNCLITSSCSQSPVSTLKHLNSDGDDSIISLDSPLPLSERLKLRLQK
ncbi:flap endonuclease GEN homolog 1 [Erpetoichthys calabaricus]|uniref:Flap endonuclease GEN homolog 1 n=1 Tax=Erpetoichthys calabaricus TaxID=27687 RepID=A0A8C4RTA8_ERPCA|nr:flap endonuclease GEN homolog 1 [Erpetoichthys calabaricus]